MLSSRCCRAPRTGRTAPVSKSPPRITVPQSDYERGAVPSATSRAVAIARWNERRSSSSTRRSRGPAPHGRRHARCAVRGRSPCSTSHAPRRDHAWSRARRRQRKPAARVAAPCEKWWPPGERLENRLNNGSFGRHGDRSAVGPCRRRARRLQSATGRQPRTTSAAPERVAIRVRPTPARGDGALRHRSRPSRSVPRSRTRDLRPRSSPLRRAGVSYTLTCGVFAHGFVRLHCDCCRRDLLVAFVCKGRGIYPSCSARRMCNSAAHIVDRVLPSVPVTAYPPTSWPSSGRRTTATARPSR